MGLRVAILGRTRILYETIDKIIKAGHDVVLIGTCKAAPEYDIKEVDFENKANEIGAVFFNDIHINDINIINLMKTVNADIALSMNWITIINQEAISCFKHGILNAHCGDLPRYRGNACPNWAIIKGDKEYAISIHYMDPAELDSGEIVIKKKYPILEETTITEIYNNMQNEIPGMFCKAVEIIENGKEKNEIQSTDIQKSLRCYPRIPEDSFIDWNDTCKNIMRIVRASTHPFQGAFCFYEGIKVFIFDAKTKKYSSPCYVYPGQVIRVNKVSGNVEIAAKDGIIFFSKVTIQGEEYRASEILKSTRIRLNYCIPNEIYLLKEEIRRLKETLLSIQKKINFE